MRKTIGGERYNTSSDEIIASFCGDGGRIGFRLYRETLYRNRNGKFFLHGENLATGRSAIVPVSAYDARVWVKKHPDSQIFGTL